MSQNHFRKEDPASARISTCEDCNTTCRPQTTTTTAPTQNCCSSSTSTLKPQQFSNLQPAGISAQTGIATLFDLRLKNTKAIQTRNLLEKLNKENIPTNDVRSIGNKVYEMSHQSKKITIDLEKKLMERKVEDAQKQVNKLDRLIKDAKSTVYESIDPNSQRAKRMRKKMREDCNEVWDEKQQKNDEKRAHLRQRNGPTNTNKEKVNEIIKMTNVQKIRENEEFEEQNETEKVIEKINDDEENDTDKTKDDEKKTETPEIFKNCDDEISKNGASNQSNNVDDEERNKLTEILENCDDEGSDSGTRDQSTESYDNNEEKNDDEEMRKNREYKEILEILEKNDDDDDANEILEKDDDENSKNVDEENMRKNREYKEILKIFEKEDDDDNNEILMEYSESKEVLEKDDNETPDNNQMDQSNDDDDENGTKYDEINMDITNDDDGTDEMMEEDDETTDNDDDHRKLKSNMNFGQRWRDTKVSELDSDDDDDLDSDDDDEDDEITHEKETKKDETVEEITKRILDEYYFRKNAMIDGSITSNENDKIKYKDCDLDMDVIMDIMGVGIDLNEDMKSLGKLGPKYRTYSKFDLNDVLTNLRKCFTKQRWIENNKRMNKNRTDQQVLEQRQIFDKELNLLDLGMLKSTDLKSNSNVIMPKPAHPEMENDMAKIEHITKKTTNEYLAKIKREGKNPEEANMNSKNIRGKNNLVDIKELIRIIQSDKSHKSVAIEKVVYEKTLNKLTANGVEIDQKQLRLYERQNNALSSTFMRNHNIGHNQKNKHEIDRIKSTLLSTNNRAAKLEITLKDHKPIDKDGNFSFRPLSNLIGTIGEYNGEILVKGVEHMCPDDENVMIKSTEDWLAEVEKFNQEKAHISNIEQFKNLPENTVFVQVACDATGLFTGVQPKRAGEEIRNATIRSNVQVNTNYEELGKFIAVNKTRKEICELGLQNVVPVRKHRKGQKPTMLGAEMNRLTRPNGSNHEIYDHNPRNMRQTEMLIERVGGQKRKRSDDEITAENNKRLRLEEELIEIMDTIKEDNENENEMMDEITNMMSKLNGENETQNETPENDEPDHTCLTEESAEIETVDSETNYRDQNQSEIETTENSERETDIVIDLVDEPESDDDDNAENESFTNSGEQENEKEFESGWSDPRREPNEEEKLLMRAIELGMMVQFHLENHCYQIGNKIYHQTSGGIIGSNLMRATAAVYMQEWMIKLKDLFALFKLNSDEMFEQLLEALLKLLYVDDIIKNMLSFPLGTVVDLANKKLWIDETIIDEQSKIPADKRAAKIFTDIANSIDKDIKMNADVASDHPELGYKLPYLDCQSWMHYGDNNYPMGQNLHMHYKKPMSSKILITKGSAINAKSIRTIHTQELIRILRNNHRNIDMRLHNGTITNYMKVLRNSGYDEEYRSEIMISGHKGFEIQVIQHALGKKPLYRPREWRKDEREKEKQWKKDNWYKKSGEYNQFLMIPQTPHSELKKELEKQIRPYNKETKIKVVERPGPKLQDVLKGQINSDEKPPCPDIENCMVCKNGSKKNGDCQKTNVVYEIKCNDCNDPNVKYIGETSRNCVTRSKEHIKQAMAKTKPKKKDDHFIIEHKNSKHEGKMPEFEMKVRKSYQHDALARRCAEAILIEELGGSKLNSKNEWRQPEQIVAAYYRNDNKGEGNNVKKTTNSTENAAKNPNQNKDSEKTKLTKNKRGKKGENQQKITKFFTGK